ncbi:MAG: hypothetical protein LBC20_04880 [Planctomycetaceae bacterium]|jgi:hypothetical protein|nr:hypothetical protein [Planctomycetaceae bacterium]
MFNFSKTFDRMIVLLITIVILFSYILLPYVNADGDDPNPNINGNVLKCGTVCLPCEATELKFGGGVDPDDPTQCLDEFIGYAYSTCQSPDPPDTSALCIENDMDVVVMVDYEWQTEMIMNPECIASLIADILIGGGTITVCTGVCTTLLVPTCIACLATLTGEGLDLGVDIGSCFDFEDRCKAVTGKKIPLMTVAVCSL